MPGTVDLRPAAQSEFLDLLAVRDRFDYGEADLTRGLVFDVWRTRSFVADLNSVVAVQAHAPLGAGVVVPGGALAFVLPEAERQGVGRRLLAWAEERGTALNNDCHRQRIAAANQSGNALLTQAGYSRCRSVYHMWLALDGPGSSVAPPNQIAVTSLDVERDASALAEADARMFAGNADYTPMSFQDFYDEHLLSPQLDASLSLVARREDTVVGFALCRRWGRDGGFIDLLAVDPAQRRQSLGAALLHGALDGFARAGLRQARLDVASDNPTAMRLYEGAGMAIRHETLVLEKPA
jgi:mycothiol synthase